MKSDADIDRGPDGRGAGLKVLAVVRDSKTASQIRNALVKLTDVGLTVVTNHTKTPLTALLSSTRPDVLLLEIAEHSDDEIERLKAIISFHADGLNVYAISKSDDGEMIRKLMRAGVRDVLPSPVPQQDLIVEMTQEISRRRERDKHIFTGRGAISSFLNAKGGAGATFVATQVACTLAASGEARVCLVDLDVQCGVASLNLDLEPRAHVMEALVAPQRVDATFVQALATRHKSGLDVLASPCELSGFEGIKIGATRKLLVAAAEAYDMVIVELPRIFTFWTIEALEVSDPVMLVLQNKLEMIRNAKVILEYLPAMGVLPNKVEIIHNRYDAETPSVGLADLKKTLSREHFHSIRNDHETASLALDRGVPIVEISKRSPLTHDIQEIADYLKVLRFGQPDRTRPGIFKRLFQNV